MEKKSAAPASTQSQGGPPLPPGDARRNFRAFLWHSVFLALTTNFVETNTVVPALVLRAGAGAAYLGVVSAVLIGGSSLFQILFAGPLSRRRTKKGPLLVGIHLRILSLALMALLLWRSRELAKPALLGGFLLLVSVFSLSGSFAGVAYTDLLGRSIAPNQRKRFFSLRQIANAVGTLASAFVVRALLIRLSFPTNFAVAFLAAASLLWMASGGFWLLREPALTGAPQDRGGAQGPGGPGTWRESDHTADAALSARSLPAFLAGTVRQIRRDPQLARYLLVLNSVGLAVAVTPFVVLLAKDRFGLGGALVGDFLVLRTLGMLLAGVALLRLSHRLSYRHILAAGGMVGAAVPAAALLFHSPAAFTLLFFASGLSAAAYKMAIAGVLLEISTDSNRAVYAGISGAGSILVVLFPVLAGRAVSWLDISWILILVSGIVLLGVRATLGLRCRPWSHAADAAPHGPT